VRFEKREAIFKIDLKRIFPSQIFRAGDANHLRGPEWHFQI
jgi:hypothetical protein